MHIPLPDLLRKLREALVRRRLEGPVARWTLRLWAAAATHPRLYRRLAAWGAAGLRWISRLPAPVLPKRLPVPEGETFQQLWSKREPETTGTQRPWEKGEEKR